MVMSVTSRLQLSYGSMYGYPYSCVTCVRVPYSSVIQTGEEKENMLVKVLQVALADESFKINTPSIIQAKESAGKFLEWCLSDANKDSVDSFTKQLVECLQNVISSSITKSFRYNKEKLWRDFYILRTSKDFIKQWTDFLHIINMPTIQPVLYQRLTDEIFKLLIQSHFQVVHLDEDASANVTSNERNALRYVAGYVCRHLRKKIERENHELKEEMILCLMELLKDKSSSGEVCETDEEWMKRIDRGGLCCVKETTFQLFCAIEYQIRALLNALKNPQPPAKTEIIKKVINDDDVQFYWLITSADFEIDDQDTHNLLLNKIVELFLTVRGFSLAGVWMEKYKQLSKKSTQRSKSLRREVYDHTAGSQ